MSIREAASFASRLLEVRDECAGVKTFRFEVPGDFTFVPGMWLMLNFPDDPKTSRAFSLSSSPFEKGAVELSAMKVAGFSTRLFGLRPGDALTLRGPYGKWLYVDDTPHAVLISGGTGITPFRAICRYVLEKKLPNRLTLLYSAKTPADIVYRDELARWQAAGIKTYVTVTRPEEAPVWKGPTGRITMDVVRREVPDLDQAVFFLCGPNKLVEELSAGLRAAGVDATRIRREKWGDYSF